ncbi:15-cis-phytoene desaturase [Posidoniimonas polymericola]|uniref:15-cis-phytoene desaturase n=1 Tax=Posidoniimonas polymericola TaxID=2528002 RepID=A0A5C5XWA8_9BACT|nr:NAD(P)/FAD-dependent oxidoreductase [Posidoniimonas polymericola]TWT67617.1 15-cis-phytoene desaturase [Posidoniimonas polymericola]
MDANNINDDNDSRRHWAVVGGGMLGMTLALRLAQQGQRVTLLEAAPTLGGLASAWRLGDVTWDRFYHVTLLSDSSLRGLLAEIGLEDSMRWIETKTGFYSGGRLHSMSNSVEFLRFPPLTLIEKLRLGGTIFLASKLKNWRRLEKVSVESWLRRYSGGGVFEKIWLPLLKAKLGETYKQTSAAFIWAHINRMYAARRSGLKKEMFGYVPGGYSAILERLAQTLDPLGVEIKCSSPVHEALSVEDGSVSVSAGDQPPQRFDRVVFTTPTPSIVNAVPELRPEERQRFEGVRYLGIVCASLLLKKPISKYYVTNITDAWVPLTAVIEMTTIVDRDELGGSALVYLPKYVPSDDPLFEESDESLQERWIGTLEKMYPHFSRDDVQAFQVCRARNVMAMPTIGYSEKLPPLRTSVPGVFAVNSAHILKGNLNVNETVQVADEAITGVLASELGPAAGRRPSRPAPTGGSDAQADRELVARS